MERKMASIVGIKRCPVVYKAPQSRSKQKPGEAYLVNPSYAKLISTYRKVRDTQDCLNVYCKAANRDALIEKSLKDFMSGNWTRKR